MTNGPIADGWLTTGEAARLTDFARGWIRQLAITGRVKAEKVGHIWVIEQTSLEQYKATARKPGRPSSEEEKTGDD